MCLSTESVKEITSCFTKALSGILALKKVSKDLVGFLQKKKEKEVARASSFNQKVIGSYKRK